MVVPVRVKDDCPPPDKNDLATPAREITSRHRVDRRSLLPPRGVLPWRGMQRAGGLGRPVFGHRVTSRIVRWNARERAYWLRQVVFGHEGNLIFRCMSATRILWGQILVVLTVV